MTESHTRENYTSIINTITDNWHVPSKVSFAVSDNAAYIIGVLKIAKMKVKGSSLNLTVEKGLVMFHPFICKLKAIVSGIPN